MVSKPHMNMFIYVIVGVLKCKVSDKFGTVQIQLFICVHDTMAIVVISVILC